MIFQIFLMVLSGEYFQAEIIIVFVKVGTIQ